MTIETTTVKIAYLGDAVNKDFPFNFKTFDQNSIKVYEDGVASAALLTVVLNLDQEASPGGSVNVDPAPADLVRVTVTREEPLTQVRDYITGGKFPAESHEQGLDKAVQILQQHSEELSRKVGVGINDDGSTDFTLPPYVSRRALVWDVSLKKLITTVYDPDAAAASAAAALVSEAAAAASAADATSALFTIKSIQLDSAAVDPSVDGNGNAVTTGDWYFNTVSTLSRVYNGVSWQNLTPGVYASIDDSGVGTSIIIDAINNVGIGAALKVWHSNFTVLQIGQNCALVAGKSTNDIRFYDNAYIDATGTERYIVAGRASRFIQSNGSQSFVGAATGVADGAITFTYR